MTGSVTRSSAPVDVRSWRRSIRLLLGERLAGVVEEERPHLRHDVEVVLGVEQHELRAAERDAVGVRRTDAPDVDAANLRLAAEEVAQVVRAAPSSRSCAIQPAWARIPSAVRRVTGR